MPRCGCRPLFHPPRRGGRHRIQVARESSRDQVSKFSIAEASCFWLAMHWLRRASSRADCTAGSSSAISVPMIVTITSNSTNVKALRRRSGESAGLGNFPLSPLHSPLSTLR